MKHCPIKRLYLAYNAFKAIYPGIIQYGPRLEYIDVSHNFLVPLLTSAFFIETLLHKGLQETDFSDQGLGYPEGIKPAAHPRTLSGPERINHRSRKSLGIDTLQQRIAAITPDGVTSEAWAECINATIWQPCKAFNPNCSEVMNYLRHNHEQFCELLYTIFDDLPSGNFSRGIRCSALPRVDDMFQKNCSDCFVIPVMGSISRIAVNNLNRYDHDRNVHLECFHQSNQLGIPRLV